MTTIGKLDLIVWSTRALEGVISINATGVITQCGLGAQVLFGYRGFELLNQNVTVLMSKEIGHAHGTFLSRFADPRKRKMVGTRRVVEAKHRDGSALKIALEVSDAERNQPNKAAFCARVVLTDEAPSQLSKEVLDIIAQHKNDSEECHRPADATPEAEVEKESQPKRASTLNLGGKKAASVAVAIRAMTFAKNWAARGRRRASAPTGGVATPSEREAAGVASPPPTAAIQQPAGPVSEAFGEEPVLFGRTHFNPLVPGPARPVVYGGGAAGDPFPDGQPLRAPLPPNSPPRPAAGVPPPDRPAWAAHHPAGTTAPGAFAPPPGWPASLPFPPPNFPVHLLQPPSPGPRVPVARASPGLVHQQQHQQPQTQPQHQHLPGGFSQQPLQWPQQPPPGPGAMGMPVAPAPTGSWLGGGQNPGPPAWATAVPHGQDASRRPPMPPAAGAAPMEGGEEFILPGQPEGEPAPAPQMGHGHLRQSPQLPSGRRLHSAEEGDRPSKGSAARYHQPVKEPSPPSTAFLGGSHNSSGPDLRAASPAVRPAEVATEPTAAAAPAGGRSRYLPPRPSQQQPSGSGLPRESVFAQSMWGASTIRAMDEQASQDDDAATAANPGEERSRIYDETEAQRPRASQDGSQVRVDGRNPDSRRKRAA